MHQPFVISNKMTYFPALFITMYYKQLNTSTTYSLHSDQMLLHLSKQDSNSQTVTSGTLCSAH